MIKTLDNSNLNPKITVGLIVYNGEEFIANAIESLLQQTYKNFEVIISDNNSEDKTEEICKQFCDLDNRLKYIKQEFNKGMQENHNIVLEKAKGDYFIWMSHDDLFQPEFFSVCLKEFQKDKKLTSVFTSFCFIDKKNNILKSNVVLDFYSNSICDQLHKYWDISSLSLEGYLGWSSRDIIMYSLTKTDVIKNKFKLKNWNWPNNKVVTTHAHLIANFLLASGKFKCVKGYDLFYKRLKEPSLNKVQTSFLKKTKEKVLGCILVLQLIIRTFILVYNKKNLSFICLAKLAVLLFKFYSRIVISYLLLPLIKKLNIATINKKL